MSARIERFAYVELPGGVGELESRADGEGDYVRYTDHEADKAAALQAQAAEHGKVVEAFARLLRECESAGWPKTAEQMMPMNEARSALRQALSESQG